MFLRKNSLQKMGCTLPTEVIPWQKNRRDYSIKNRKKQKFIFQITTVVLLLATAFSGLKVQSSQINMLNKSLDLHINTTKIKIFRDINDQFEALIRMASRWDKTGGLYEPMWRNDAKNYVRDIEGIDALMFIDSDHKVSWKESKESYEFEEGISLKSFRDLSERLDQAAASDQLELTKPVQRANGDYVVYMIKSISLSNQMNNYIVARINTSDFFDKVLISSDDTGFHTQVKVGGDEIYHNGVVEEINGFRQNVWSAEYLGADVCCEYSLYARSGERGRRHCQRLVVDRWFS